MARFTTTHMLVGVLLAAGAVAAFAKRSEPEPQAVAHAEPMGEPEQEHEHAMAPMPMPSHAQPAQQGSTFDGRVAEVIQVPNYTYLRLTTGSGETWAAVTTSNITVGDRVVITNATAMQDFQSTTLKRTFTTIWFGALGTSPAPSASVGVPVAAVGPVPGGLRIADVHARRKALAGTTVKVRGTVVKATGVMGSTYVHVRDGSGSGDGGDDDLTLVTQATPQAGDVITVSGTVEIDKDVGAGYTYPVILTGAKVE